MKHLLVIGGASDIGIATARYFAERGFSVQLAGRNETYLQRIARDLQIRTESEVTVVLFDATNFDSHQQFYQHLTHRPDVCLCVFGYLGDQSLAQADWKEAELIIDTNFKGAVSILNIVSKDFSERGEGSIIGVSSVAGERGRQSNYIYGSAKAGFTAYLSGLRNQMNHSGVHVLTVNPGFVKTKMTENHDLPPLLTAEPGQVAKAIYKAYRAKKNVIYVLWMWRYIMLAIKSVPESVFKKLKL